MFITIPKININPIIAFTGTEEEIERLEKLEEDRSAAWQKIIENPDFSALGFQSGFNYHILSRNTDNNGKYRLTYFWNGTTENGKTYVMDPSMHENYQGKEENYIGAGLPLLSVLTNFCFSQDIVVEIV